MNIPHDIPDIFLSTKTYFIPFFIVTPIVTVVNFLSRNPCSSMTPVYLDLSAHLDTPSPLNSLSSLTFFPDSTSLLALVSLPTLTCITTGWTSQFNQISDNIIITNSHTNTLFLLIPPPISSFGRYQMYEQLHCIAHAVEYLENWTLADKCWHQEWHVADSLIQIWDQ